MRKFAHILLLTLIAYFFPIGSCNTNIDEITTYSVNIRYTEELPESDLKRDITIYEYNRHGAINARHTMKDIAYGTTETFRAADFTTKVKLLVRVYDLETSTELWVHDVYYLVKDKNLEIFFSNKTKLTPNEPE